MEKRNDIGYLAFTPPRSIMTTMLSADDGVRRMLILLTMTTKYNVIYTINVARIWRRERQRNGKGRKRRYKEYINFIYINQYTHGRINPLSLSRSTDGITVNPDKGI